MNVTFISKENLQKWQFFSKNRFFASYHSFFFEITMLKQQNTKLPRCRSKSEMGVTENPQDPYSHIRSKPNYFKASNLKQFEKLNSSSASYNTSMFYQFLLIILSINFPQILLTKKFKLASTLSKIHIKCKSNLIQIRNMLKYLNVS